MSFDEIFDLTAGVYFNFYNITKDAFVSHFFFFFIKLIELNSIRFGGNIRIGSYYPETTYCVLSIFFSDRNNITDICRDGDAANRYHHRRLELLRILLHFLGSFASLLWHFFVLSNWWPKLVLRPPLFFLTCHSRGTLWHDDLLQSSSRKRGCSLIIKVHDFSTLSVVVLSIMPLKLQRIAPRGRWPSENAICKLDEILQFKSNSPPKGVCIYPSITRTWNFCKFCRTFIPVPGTCVRFIKIFQGRQP